ncbi:unnamed protein product [Colias eurytheme]|nr:unnamed protein product [Colias eurytheme]
MNLIVAAASLIAANSSACEWRAGGARGAGLPLRACGRLRKKKKSRTSRCCRAHSAGRVPKPPPLCPAVFAGATTPNFNCINEPVQRTVGDDEMSSFIFTRRLY